MKYTGTITVEATQFNAEAFEQIGETKDKSFQDIEVRHNGSEHFVMLPQPDGRSVKVLEGQWIVTDKSGVKIWHDNDFKEAFQKVKEDKKAKVEPIVPVIPSK